MTMLAVPGELSAYGQTDRRMDGRTAFQLYIYIDSITAIYKTGCSGKKLGPKLCSE